MTATTPVLTPHLRAQIAQTPRTQMYMDSPELTVYGAGGLLWGATVAEDCRSRRGYDITPGYSSWPAPHPCSR